MKVGVVGAGVWGKNHLRTLNEMNVLGAVVETDPEKQAQVREQYPSVPLVSSLDELEGDQSVADIGAFVVASPAATHVEVALRLFAMQKHVLVEKPMALNSEDAEAIVEAAKAANRTLMVGHLLLFQPAIQFIKRYLDDEKLGRVYTLTQRRSKLGRARSVENVLWSFGVHDVAVLLFLVGEAPCESMAHGHSAITDGVQDDVHLHMRFKNGILANLHNSWLWPRDERELIITGEKGILVFDEIQQKVVLHRKRIDSALQNQDEGEEIVFENADQPLRLELEHFLDCCGSGQTPIANGSNGLEVTRALEQCR